MRVVKLVPPDLKLNVIASVPDPDVYVPVTKLNPAFPFVPHRALE